jgi:formylglycine-generating enzyme required for sulfatase activity
MRQFANPVRLCSATVILLVIADEIALCQPRDSRGEQSINFSGVVIAGFPSEEVDGATQAGDALRGRINKLLSAMDSGGSPEFELSVSLVSISKGSQMVIENTADRSVVQARKIDQRSVECQIQLRGIRRKSIARKTTICLKSFKDVGQGQAHNGGQLKIDLPPPLRSHELSEWIESARVLQTIVAMIFSQSPELVKASLLKARGQSTGRLLLEGLPENARKGVLTKLVLNTKPRDVINTAELLGVIPKLRKPVIINALKTKDSTERLRVLHVLREVALQSQASSEGSPKHAAITKGLVSQVVPRVLIFLADDSIDVRTETVSVLTSTAHNDRRVKVAFEKAAKTESDPELKKAIEQFISGAKPAQSPTKPTPSLPGSKPRVGDNGLEVQETSFDLGLGVKMDFVLCPPGQFQMGSPVGSLSARPQHQVWIKKAFYIGKCEVTEEQWERVMNNGLPLARNEKRMPKGKISRRTCSEFCRALSVKTGRVVRMPSEAEWEYACRAGDSRLANPPISPQDLGAVAWWAGNSHGGKPHAVGQKLPNSWGLFDMLGNLSEYCEDLWHHDYKGAPTDGGSWVTHEGDGFARLRGGRVARGGNFTDHNDTCCATSRWEVGEDEEYRNLGFRVVIDAASR